MSSKKQILVFTLLTASVSLGSVLPAQAQDYSKFNYHIAVGIGTPVGSTADFAGTSGAFQVGAGPNLSEHSSLVGEFMWHGLPPNSNALRNLVSPLAAAKLAQNFSASSNLYALTANYKYHREGDRYGFYLIGGGGWYYRRSQLSNYQVELGTVCAPTFDYWGYTCEAGFVSTENVLVARGTAAAGANAGGGIVIKLGDSRMKWYIEARYHYSPQGDRVAAQVLPVTFGLQW